MNITFLPFSLDAYCWPLQSFNSSLIICALFSSLVRNNFQSFGLLVASPFNNNLSSQPLRFLSSRTSQNQVSIDRYWKLHHYSPLCWTVFGQSLQRFLGHPSNSRSKHYHHAQLGFPLQAAHWHYLCFHYIWFDLRPKIIVHIVQFFCFCNVQPYYFLLTKFGPWARWSEINPSGWSFAGKTRPLGLSWQFFCEWLWWSK